MVLSGEILLIFLFVILVCLDVFIYSAPSFLTWIAYHTGINHLTDSQMIGTLVVLIGTLKMVTIKIGASTEMAVHEVVTGMEMEGQHVMREEVTGVGRLLMTAQIGVGGHLLLTDTSMVC